METLWDQYKEYNHYWHNLSHMETLEGKIPRFAPCGGKK